MTLKILFHKSTVAMAMAVAAANKFYAHASFFVLMSGDIFLC